MRSSIIINPKTGKKNRVVIWQIDARNILAMKREGRFQTPRQLSWLLLNDRSAIAKMEDEIEGESPNCNFALRIFETALDWSLGLTVLNFILQCVRAKKMPKPFQVAANHRGDVFIITASGRILTYA